MKKPSGIHKHKWKFKHVVCLFSTLCIGVIGCTPATSSSKDILTNKKTEDGRTQITVLVKYAFGVNQFEQIVEEQFPDIDIVQVGNYTANTTLAKEYEARLEHDDLTDIVFTWPLDVGEQYWSDRLIDLSGLPFTSKYNISMLDTIADDEGRLYYIPGPADIRGIIYNKTMFEENGWSVPNNYTEFIALCKTIEATGIRAFQLPLGNKEVLDTAFIGFNYGNAYSKPYDSQWLDNYNEGNGKFEDQFKDALSTFQNLIDEKILQQEDLYMQYAQTQSNLVTRKSAMTEDSVLLARNAKAMGNESDEFALMPFFNRNPENDWARIYMTCYIGLNKELQNSENKEKYDKVLKLMAFISTPEGQKALASDNGAMYSSLKGVEAPNIKEISDLRASLSQGRYGTFPTLNRSEEAFHEGLRAMINQEMSAAEVALFIDENNINTEDKKDDIVFAQATKDFTMIDTGNLVCDILKKEAETDIALFLDNGKDGLYNGKGISARLYQGDVTEIDLTRLFPDLKTEESGKLVKVTMSGKNIKEALEYSLTVSNQDGWFYYFSGLKVTMDPYAEVGSRIKVVTLSDGVALEDDKDYTVATMEYNIDEAYITSSTSTNKLILDVLRDHLQQMETVSPSEDTRFTILAG